MIGPMISVSGTTQILLANEPVDFRKQADSLAALVQQALGADGFSGAVYVLRAKQVDRVTHWWWDGTGLCLEASGRLPFSLATHRGWRDAVIGCVVVRACGGPRLGARCIRRGGASEGCTMTAAEIARARLARTTTRRAKPERRTATTSPAT